MFRWREGQPPRENPRLRFVQQDHKGHGRIERRRLIAATVTPGSVHWPGARQVMRLEATRTLPGKPTSTEYHCGVTSLGPEHAHTADLLELMRGHWGIENRLFHVRDVTLGEDACRVRVGQAPRNLAMLRNLVVSLLNLNACTNHAAALRRHAARPEQALALIHAPPREN
jgi:hypothetical protein